MLALNGSSYSKFFIGVIVYFFYFAEPMTGQLQPTGEQVPLQGTDLLLWFKYLSTAFVIILALSLCIWHLRMTELALPSALAVFFSMMALVGFVAYQMLVVVEVANDDVRTSLAMATGAFAVFFLPVLLFAYRLSQLTDD